MNKILFVPGKNPKPPATLHREQLLRCLLHGVGRQDAGVAGAIGNGEAFHLVAWNFLLYHRSRDIRFDIPWVDRLLARKEVTMADIEDARPLKYRLAKLLYGLGDLFHWLILLLPDRRIRASIRDTGLYFANADNIACRIREVLKLELRRHAGAGDRVLLIGHSMGSIIAWDALWELHHDEGIGDCVDCLLTIGSPLGMRYVQKRLLGLHEPHPRRYPGNLRRWVNISARGDLVALDPVLANDFGDMVKRGYVDSIDDHREGIYNHYRDDRGLNVHKSYGYLVNPVVDGVITDWWSAA